MLPNDTTGSPPVADIVYHPFRIRSDSESQQTSGPVISADGRRQSISEGLRAAIDGGDGRRSRHASGSRGSVFADLFRFRQKSTSPQAVAAAAKTSAEPKPKPDPNVVPTISHPTQWSSSTADRPQQLLYLTDPSVNRPQVSLTAVESSRARVLRQRKDLAPQWIKVSSPQDPSPPSAIYGDANGQSLPAVPQMTSGSGIPVIMSRKDEAPKRSVFDSNWNQNPAYKHTGRRLSLFPTPSLPLNSADPEFGSGSDSRPRSGSRGFADFFRIRKKSSTNSPSLVITPPSSESKDSVRSKSPLRSPPQKTTRRQRSKSTVEPPVLSPEQRYQWKETEPIAVRVFNAKRDLPPDMRLSLPCSPEEPQATPMSDLLSRQSVPGASKLQAFGIRDFLHLYNSQNNNNNSSFSKRDNGLRSPTRTSFEIQRSTVDDFSSTGLDDDATTSSSLGFISNTRIISGQTLQLDLPESIPEYLEVHQVSSTSSLQPTRTRRMSPANNQLQDSESSRELMDKQYGTSSSRRMRRYSEPPKPNLRQMAVLNSIHMKLVCEKDNGGSEQGQDYNKALSSPTAIAQSLGIKIPMTSRHELLLWRDKETGAQLLKLPVSGKGHQDDLYDIDSNGKLTFVKLMKLHKCHELMPQSAKLVLLDSELEVISAFFALMFNEIRAAPIWESSERDFVGMLTVTDFINVLQMHYNSPEEVGNLEEHKISKWIDLLHGPHRSMITVDPDDRLFDAVVQLSTNRIHRILVADSVNGDALYVLSYKRILRFIYLLTYEVHLPSYMDQSIWDLQIGTYGDKLCTVTPKTRLIDALNLLVQKRISAVPVVNDNGQPINIYAKVDVINLAANESYKNLDTTVEETLKLEREKFEGVFLCKRTDTLHQVMKWFIQENIHRLLVVDDDMLLVGIVSLSDIVHFLVIRQSEESGGYFQPGDINLEIDINL